VTFVARVGRDIFGDKAVAGFRQDGIDTGFITRDPKKPSGVALIFVAKDGENSIAVAGGANCGLVPALVTKASGAFRNTATLLMQLETPLETVETAARMASEKGIRVILNPAPACPLPSRLLRLVSILTPNETEAAVLSGVRVKDEISASKAAERLLGLGVQNVILTLGARGAYVATNTLRQLVPGFRVRAIDCTAAGDVFNGALAVAISEGNSLVEAVRFANAAAAISVTRLGAQPSAPKRFEIEARLRRNR
jgi:ribokinase